MNTSEEVLNSTCENQQPKQGFLTPPLPITYACGAHTQDRERQTQKLTSEVFIKMLLLGSE